jgi:hypothetical protein
MVGTGAPAGASASGLRFCTSIPPGRTSHSSSFTAAEAGAGGGGGGGGGELSLIASANVPLGLARIIFSWYVHAPRASEAREGGTERIKNQPLLLRALASNSSQERATSGRVSSALLGCPRNDLCGRTRTALGAVASRSELGGAGSGEDDLQLQLAQVPVPPLGSRTLDWGNQDQGPGQQAER